MKTLKLTLSAVFALLIALPSSGEVPATEGYTGVDGATVIKDQFPALSGVAPCNKCVEAVAAGGDIGLPPSGAYSGGTVGAVRTLTVPTGPASN